MDAGRPLTVAGRIRQLPARLGGTRLVCVDGPAGSGKSALATQFVAEGVRQGEAAVVAVFEERPGEYVARAGRPKAFYVWGDDVKDACREANVYDRAAAKARPELQVKGADCDDGYPSVAPVGRLQPNPFGLYDVIGNVWEWVEDCYAMPHPANAPVDGSAQLKEGCDRRSVRGGSWISAVERNRPTFRGRDPVTLTTQIFGFRIARDLGR